MKIKAYSYNEDIIEIDDKELENLNEFERNDFIDDKVAEWNYKNLSDLTTNWEIIKDD